MADLSLTFSEIYNLVSEFLGYGSSPAGTNLTNCKNCVYSGLRRFYFPISMKTGRKHTWSFLKKHLVLTTVTGEWQYELPQNFREFISGLQYDTETGYIAPVKVDPEYILNLRATSVIDSYPSHYALIKPGFTKETGSNWEIWFYGNPDGKYILHGIYIINPDKPSATTDVFPGGVEASEAILENCLAVAEQNYDEVEGIHTKRAEELTQKLILHDFVGVPETVGPNLDIGRIERKRFLEALDESDVYAD